jgi:hypothetical protein
MHLIFRNQQGHEPAGAHERALHLLSTVGVEHGCGNVWVFIRRNVREVRMSRTGKSPERCERLPARRNAWVLSQDKSIQLNNEPMTLIGRERTSCVQDGGEFGHDYWSF